MMKELSAVSQRGFAIGTEERSLRSHCIVAPVADSTGQTISGLSNTAPAFRVIEEELISWSSVLIAAVAEISRRLAPRR